MGNVFRVGGKLTAGRRVFAWRGPAAEKYSRFVQLMKLFLPGLAAVLLGLIVVWPQLRQRDDRFHLAFADFNPRSVDNLSMTNPRFYGTDQHNQPFAVTADVATQSDPANMVVSLENPKADVTLHNGRGMVMNADIGFFRQKDETVDLMSNVDLFHDDGFEMHTQSARINLRQGSAQGDEAVHGQGPFGQVQSQGFALQNHGRVVVFTGKTHMHLITRSTRTPPAAPKSRKAS